MAENRARSGARAIKVAPEPITPEDRRDKHLIGRVGSAELTLALNQVDFALVVWDRQGTIRLANQAAADLAGKSLAEVIGTPVKDYASPADAIETSIADLADGHFEEFRAKRSVNTGRGEPVPIWSTARAIEVDGQRGGVSVIVPRSELGRLGRRPLRGRGDLIPVAVGVADRVWTILLISSEVDELIGRQPRECIGQGLLDMAHPEDAAEILERGYETPAQPFSFPQVRFGLTDGSWRQVCVLVAPVGLGEGARICFALAGRIDESFPQPLDRVKELELRLRRIGAEVRAAGFLDSMDLVPSLEEYPQLGELTSRQWEILNRLLRGERVPTIAKELFVSQSTVRNHVSTIFERFGVHSQPELLALLRRKDGPSG